jgi:hypothetical protein
LFDIAVDAVENRVECAHEQLRKGKPDWETGRSTRGLYILILAGLFGNRWNANKVPATSTSSFMITPMGKNDLAETRMPFDAATSSRNRAAPLVGTQCHSKCH